MRSINNSTIVAFLLFLTGIAIYGQDEPIRIETNLVTRNVAAFSAENSPVSIGIVYDLHPATNEKTIAVLKALKQFTSELWDGDDFFVSVFNEKGTLTTDFVSTLVQVREQIADIGSNSPRSLYDSIIAAGTRVAGLRNPKKILLVLSDGADRSSHHSVKELRLHLRRVNLPVYALTFNDQNRSSYSYSDIQRQGPRQTFAADEISSIDRSILNEISRTSGGQTFSGAIRNRQYLAAMASKLLAEAREQYVVGFYPAKPDGM
ncbi:MAG: hypothetical protein ABI539_14320 [Acidobacteriota bacterium]